MADADAVTYPPLDVLKTVTDGIWIVDSGPFRVAGLVSIPVRMTAVRLQGGSVWLHSPTRWTRELQRQIEAIGPIRYLVVPNPFHWSFARQWKEHCPDALVAAAEGTSRRWLVRLKGPSIGRSLAGDPLPDWAADFVQVMVRGRFVFREIAFFHRLSRTAILTDLIVNVEPEKVPVWYLRGVAAVGSLGPEGRAPFYARLDYRMNRKQAAAAVAQLIALAPERVIFSHGKWFARDGAQRLAVSLRWLTS